MRDRSAAVAVLRFVELEATKHSDIACDASDQNCQVIADIMGVQPNRE